jgi:hypothetical protein
MHMAIYDQLVQLAHTKRLTTYSDIAPLAGLSMDDEEDRNKMSQILVEILQHEADKGRPMLTAIVVHKGQDNNPGEGFFSAVTDLGRYSGSRNALTRLEFWVRQVGEVHSYWTTHQPPAHRP